MRVSELQANEINATEDEIATVRRLVGMDDTGTVERNEIGWTSRVYLVNGGEYVVKFPRTDAVKEEYRREIVLLRQLEACNLPELTPRILWTHPEQEYMGYAGIVGTSLDLLIHATTADERSVIGKQVGGFLKALHALQMPDAFSMSLDEEIAEFHYKYGLGTQVFERDLTAAERKQLDEIILREIPAALTRLGADVAFCHGDLGYWNMIIGQGAQLGIIDFGDCGYYDRAKDFSALEDADLRENALHVYGADDCLRERIALRRRLLPVVDLPFYIGKQNEEGVARTVTRIRRNSLAGEP
jgi:aminoglycoside phosphotransferase (APT) family kinase protein